MKGVCVHVPQQHTCQEALQRVVHQKKLLAKDESKDLDSTQPSADSPEDEIDSPMLFGWNVNQLNKDVGGSPNGRAHVHRVSGGPSGN